MTPKEWKQKTLKDLNAYVTSGSRGWAPYYSEKGDYFIRMTNLKRDKIALDYSNLKYVQLPKGSKEGRRTRLQKGDILVSITADLGVIGYIKQEPDVPSYINQHIALARIDSSEVNTEFLAYLLSSDYVQNKIRQLNDSGSKAALNLDAIRGIPVTLPLLTEQNRVTEILSTWCEAIDKLEKLIEAKKLRKKGLMQQLLTGKRRFDRFDGEWEEKSLEQLATITMGSSPKSEAYNEESDGLPLIQGNADIKNRLTVPRIYTSHITKTCDVDDIILSVRAPVGEVALSNVNGCIGRGVAALKTKNKIDRDFLYFLMLMNEKKWGRLSQGSTFEAVNSKDIKSFKLNCPLDFNEQRKIGEVVREANNEIERLKEKKEFYILGKKGLMQQLLTGKKRVKID
jgi:type I restriction enzyme S subunit